VQAFFERLISARLYDHADPARGRFRNFLLRALQNFLRDQHEHAQRQKRGAAVTVTMEPAGIERVASGDSPEAEFDRAWALTALDSAIARLRDECERSGKGAWYRTLEPCVLEPVEREGYQELAERLNIKPNTIAVSVGRLRKRLREHVRAELGETVQSAQDLDAELHALRDALGQAARSR
jgi:RNA polymerase sigma-70 factor (ECF subfamily)